MDDLREEGRLAAEGAFAARFDGAAGTAPGAFLFFDGCGGASLGSGLTEKLDMPGMWSLGVVEFASFESEGNATVVMERLRVLTPEFSVSSICKLVDEAEVEEPRAFLDAGAQS